MSMSLFTCSLLGCGEGAGPVQRKWATLCRADRRKSLDLPRFHTAMRHNPGHGIMTAFMTERRVIGFTVAEALKLGHLHDVAVDTVKGAIAAVPNGDVRIGEKRLGGVEPLDLIGERRHVCIKMPGQSLALFGVKDRVAFHKRD